MNAIPWLKAGLIFLLWLVLGAVVSTVAGEAMDGEGGLLTYTILFVFGIFTGVIAYQSAGPRVAAGGEDWHRRPDAPRVGRIILVTSIGLLVTLGLLFERLLWTPNGARGLPVLESAPHTVTFFASVAIGLWVLHHASIPSPPKRDEPRGRHSDL